jgi:hypothetical protein
MMSLWNENVSEVVEKLVDYGIALNHWYFYDHMIYIAGYMYVRKISAIGEFP